MAWKMRLIAVEVRDSVPDPDTGEPVSVAPGELDVTVVYFDEAAPGEETEHHFTFDARVSKEDALSRMLKHGIRYRNAKERLEQFRQHIGREFDLP